MVTWNNQTPTTFKNNIKNNKWKQINVIHFEKLMLSCCFCLKVIEILKTERLYNLQNNFSKGWDTGKYHISVNSIQFTVPNYFNFERKFRTGFWRTLKNRLLVVAVAYTLFFSWIVKSLTLKERCKGFLFINYILWNPIFSSLTFSNCSPYRKITIHQSF